MVMQETVKDVISDKPNSYGKFAGVRLMKKGRKFTLALGHCQKYEGGKRQPEFDSSQYSACLCDLEDYEEFAKKVVDMYNYLKKEGIIKKV